MRVSAHYYFTDTVKKINYDEMISKLKEILGDINLYRLDKYHLTYSELKILNHISIAYLQKGNNFEAIEILKQLVTNRKKLKISIHEEIEIIPLLLCNISSMLINSKKYDEAYDYAKKALKISNEYGASIELPEIHLNIARCINKLEKDKEKVNIFILRGFHCANALGRRTNNRKKNC